MSRGPLFQAVIVVGLLAAGSTSLAQAWCGSAITGQPRAWDREEPHLALKRILNIENPANRSEKKLSRRIERLKLEGPRSEADTRRLVRSLFAKKYGPYNRYRDLLKDSENVFDARVLRLLEEEVTQNGLLRFFEERDLTRSRSQFMTMVSNLYARPSFQVLLVGGGFAVGVARHANPNIPFAPELRFFDLRPLEIQTLLEQGIDSAAGREILNGLRRRQNIDRGYDLFQRSYNRIAMIATAVLYTWLTYEQDEEEARKNGDALIEEMTAKTAKIAASAESPDSRDDLRFDAIVQRLQSQNGKKLTQQDLKAICLQIRAPNRCKN